MIAARHGRLIGLAAAAVLAGLAPAARGDDLVELCTRVRPAFVFIRGGSGVVIRPDGLMLTNDHVLEGKRTHPVRLGDGSAHRARLLGTDPVGDLAVLKIELDSEASLPHLELGDAVPLAVGDETLAVGNPFGLGVLDQAPTFTAGIVSALHHVQGTYTECIVTDTELNPGNSGGPLLDMAGRVVGINGQISTRFGLRSNTGLGFAIGARQIRLWLPRLEAAGGEEVRHGKLVGLDLRPPDPARQGAVVADVAEGSVAAVAGIRPGDAIVGIDGAAVPHPRRLAGLVGIYPEGHDVELTVDRDGVETKLVARLAAPKRCAIGMRLERPRDDGLAARVARVEPDTPAAAAGLRVGDEIVEVDGLPVEFGSREEFRAFDRGLRMNFEEGTILAVTVRRQEDGGEPVEVDLRLVAR
jgi:S1-C subfamily serine protease